MPANIRSVTSGALLVLAVVLSANRYAAGGGTTFRPTTITGQLVSQDRRLSQIDVANRPVFGWELLVASSGVTGATQVEMLGNRYFTDGSGDFFGYVTFIFDDGSTLVTRMTTGRAKAATDTASATFSSSLRIVCGTGRFADASGHGMFTGEGRDHLGGLVDARFDLKITA